MSGSLKEELLKLGLGRKHKAVESERRNRGERSESKPKAERPRSPASPVATPPKPPNARETRELERERAKRNARLLQVLEANKVENTGAEIKHYYSTGRKIKYTYVTEAQQAALLSGELIIVIVQGKGRLVASSLLPSFREIDPELRVVDPHAAPESDNDDPDHQVPDDLRW